MTIDFVIAINQAIILIVVILFFVFSILLIFSMMKRNKLQKKITMLEKRFYLLSAQSDLEDKFILGMNKRIKNILNKLNKAINEKDLLIKKTIIVNEIENELYGISSNIGVIFDESMKLDIKLANIKKEIADLMNEMSVNNKINVNFSDDLVDDCFCDIDKIKFLLKEIIRLSLMYNKSKQIIITLSNNKDNISTSNLIIKLENISLFKNNHAISDVELKALFNGNFSILNMKYGLSFELLIIKEYLFYVAQKIEFDSCSNMIIFVK